MVPRYCILSCALLATSLNTLAAPPETTGADVWKYDVVYRKRGVPLEGLVLEQTKQLVTIRCIIRKPGSPTVLFTEYLPREEIEQVVLQEPAEREKLQKRLLALKNERKTLGDQLKLLDPGSRLEHPSGDMVTLKPADWPIEPRGQGLLYTSTHFQLLSNASEEMTHLAAIQLEQVYAAYARSLPPRAKNPKPTTILLVRSLAEYQQHLRSQERNFFNQGYFDIAKNQVVCGSDLQRLSDELERSRMAHARLTTELDERKAEMVKVYKGKVPSDLVAQIQADVKTIQRMEERNNTAFAMARQRFFQRLYHEAFHAYLNTSVYPPEEATVPVWLNEGLAQIFETAIVEAGELRVGHADKERLDEVRKALASKTLLPLPELLRSGVEQFQVARSSAQQVSDRTYLASWALAFHLTFERKILGSKAMDTYVQALKRGTDPLEAFQELVGQGLGKFEKEHLRYLDSLRPDGTSRPQNP
jgi:hypothetical protein